MKKTIISLITIWLLTPLSIFSQQKYQFHIDWENKEPEPLSCYCERIELPSHLIKESVNLQNVKYIATNIHEYPFITNESIKFDCSYGSHDNSSYCDISIVPYFYDTLCQKPCLITSFEIELFTKQKSISTEKQAATSILSSGEWYKYDIYESGVYEISAKSLVDNGIDISNLKTENLKIYAKEGYVLDEYIDNELTANPRQIPIIVKDFNQDEYFNNDDKIVFYVEGPHIWEYSQAKDLFQLKYNHYTDTASFYLSINDIEPQLLIQKHESEVGKYDTIITCGTQRFFHKTEKENLIYSGREWLGETIKMQDSIFKIPTDFKINELPENEDNMSTLYVSVAAHSKTTNKVYPFINGVNDGKYIRMSVASINHLKAVKNSDYFSFYNTEKIPTIELAYSTESPNGICWIDRVEANLRTKLKYAHSQFTFYENNFYNKTKVARYLIESDIDITILDITDPLTPKEIVTTVENGVYLFDYKVNTSIPDEFIVYDDNVVKVPKFDKKIANQDLLSISPYIDYLIITPECLYEEAEKFGLLHEKYDGHSYKVITTEDIYREYTCGQQDVTAIRDFIRLLHSRSGKEYPKYVQLIGGTSYDYKNIVVKEKNMIPTFQCIESCDESESFGTDDYFVILDEGEGLEAEGINDIPLGRIPFNTAEEIAHVRTKIEHYMESRTSPDGLWLHKYYLTADDDSQTYLKYQEYIEDSLSESIPLMNIEKIYIDAYKQERTLTGYSCQEGSSALLKAFNEGALIISYFGHGSKLGWAAENLLSVPLIQKIDNYDNMPFVCASTCEFFQFDSPGLTPAGQQLLGHKKGGTFSIISTSRLSLTDINRRFQLNYTEYIAEDSLRKDASIGKIFLSGKQFASPYVRNILLFGDPAVKLNYPNLDIEIDTINGKSAEDFFDTESVISKCSIVTLQGRICDNGQLNKMNGYIEYQVFDKPSHYTTLNSEGAGFFDFSMRDKILTKGKAKVKDGIFKIEFFVPEDIKDVDEDIKIDMYAYDTTVRNVAGGFIDKIKTSDNEADYVDNEGPTITGYINSHLFRDGDLIANDSKLYIHLSDKSGIDCSSRIIGKELTMTIDDNSTPTLLNAYFNPSADDYTSGVIEFALPELELGMHTIRIRAYDLCGNFSDYFINFTITNSVIPKICNIYNKPNPVTEQTSICFTHNLSSDKTNITIEIFDSEGKKVEHIDKGEVVCEANVEKCIKLNYNDLRNTINKNGVYLYRLTISTSTGDKSIGTGKFLIIR